MIKKTAGLAQLEVTDAEAEALVPRVQNFLSFVAAMEDTDGSSDTASAHRERSSDFLRADETRRFDNQAGILANMPLKEGNYLRVPRVGEDSS